MDGVWREPVITLKFGGIGHVATTANRFSSLRLRCSNCGEHWTLLICTYPESMTLSVFVRGDVHASEEAFAAAHELSRLEDRVRRLEKDLSRDGR